MLEQQHGSPSAPAQPPSDEERLAQLSLDSLLLRGIIEAGGRAFFLIDMVAGGLAYISPQFERLWGISRELFYADAEYWYRTIHPDDRDHCRSSAAERIENPERSHQPFDYRIYRGDGELRWMRGNVFQTIHPTTGETLLCGIAEDVTSLKYAEVEADRRREELESTVACRTAELLAANEALRAEIDNRADAEARLRDRESYLRKLIQVQELERELISYDIHDGAIQQLIGAEMHLQAAMSSANVERRDAELSKARQLMHDVIAETRRVINGIRPQTLDELGVSAAVGELVAEFAADGIEVELVDELEGMRWSPLIEVSSYRIVQESLNNVRRHARTTRAKVEMRLTGETINLTITDHGRGFTPQRPAALEFGLRGMRERAAAVGGVCRIDSAPGRGAIVHAELPTLDPAEAAVVERDRAFHALTLSRRRMMSILDRTTAVIFVKDHELNYEIVNRRHEELFHVTREYLAGKNDYDFLPKEVAEAVRENDRRVLEEGDPITIEEHVPSDGEMREYVVVKFAIPGEQGNPPSVCGIATDITDYNRERRRLIDMERRFRVFLDNLPMPAWIKRADGRYAFINRRALEMSGKDESYFLGRLDSDFLPPEQAAVLREHDLEVIRTGETRELLDVVDGSDGRPVTWRTYRFRVESSDDTQLVGGIAFERTDPK
jgi:PAS domain S-box-containing protein